MTVEYLSFNELLKLYRERKGLSQQQLAHKIGVEPSLLSKWETVLRTPRKENVNIIADALKLNLDERQNLQLALKGNLIPEALALHELLSLYLDRTELNDSHIASLVTINKDKLRDWRIGARLPTNKELDILIEVLKFTPEQINKLRSAKPRVFVPIDIGFLLMGAGFPKEQLIELITRG
jgi:transcriptional regulator with XRE-family HTH domain